MKKRLFSVMPFIISASILPVFLAPVIPAYAQGMDASLTETDSASPELKTTSSGLPVLEKVSDKGIYRVLLKWSQTQLNPAQEIDIELVFLNASAPEPTAKTVPQLETNSSGATQKGDTGFNTPWIIESTLAVESYDLAFYSGNGTELWKKTDLSVSAGRDAEHIVFANNYTGPVTINVTNIVPGWLGTESADTDDTSINEEKFIDSVTFTTTVVPEFPLFATLPLVAGIATALTILRLKSAPANPTTTRHCHH